MLNSTFLYNGKVTSNIQAVMHKNTLFEFFNPTSYQTRDCVMNIYQVGKKHNPWKFFLGHIEWFQEEEQTAEKNSTDFEELIIDP